MATVAFHLDTSQRLISQAEAELAKGDSLQAAEKGWGAAAHAVKAIAERRGWQHGAHRELFTAARIIAEEMGQAEIRELFSVASGLHKNYYEGWLDDEYIAADLASVRRLLSSLEAVPYYR